MEMTSPACIARLLGVCESTVYTWIRKGTIPAPRFRLGPSRGYTPAEAGELRRWYAERCEPRRTESDVGTDGPPSVPAERAE